MIIAQAPVRVSFGGGGTDLAAYYERFGGFVVSTAIDRYCYVMASQPTDGGIRLISADYHIREAFPRGVLPPVSGPLALAKAALAEFAEFADERLIDRGVDLVLGAEVPPGTGLGSSSAMAVALVRALADYTGRCLGPGEIAERASAIEIERLGMPIGKQDQYASAFGGLNTLVFTGSGVRVAPLALPPGVAEALGARLLLFSTGQTHNSAAILHEQRHNTSTQPVVVESLHRIKGLAWEMRSALVSGDLDAFGRTLDLAWREKRRLSDKISNAAIDAWYTAAIDAGALGGKIAGAGGGGFLLLDCPERKQPAVRRALADFGLREMPFMLERDGVRVLDGLPERAGRQVLLHASSDAHAGLPITRRNEYADVS